MRQISYIQELTVTPERMPPPPPPLFSGSLSKRLRRRQRERQKVIGLYKQNNNFASALRFFVHLFAVVARLQRECAQFPVLSRPTWNTRQQLFFPEVRYSPLEFNSKKIFLSVIKFEAARFTVLKPLYKVCNKFLF